MDVSIQVGHTLNTIEIEGWRRNLRIVSHQVPRVEDPDHKVKAGVGGEESGWMGRGRIGKARSRGYAFS